MLLLPRCPFFSILHFLWSLCSLAIITIACTRFQRLDAIKELDKNCRNVRACVLRVHVRTMTSWLPAARNAGSRTGIVPNMWFQPAGTSLTEFPTGMHRNRGILGIIHYSICARAQKYYFHPRTPAHKRIIFTAPYFRKLQSEMSIALQSECRNSSSFSHVRLF